MEEAGDVDVLVNSTGVVPAGTLEAVNAAAWRAAFASKVSGQVDVIRLVYPRMRARGGGVVVSIIGDGGEITDPAFVCGGAANAALAHVTRSLGGVSLADGIRVVGVSPGPVETEQIVSFLEERARAEHGDPARWRDYLAGYPLGRAARVEEVADLVLFLASPRASYVSGTVVTIDGGIAARRSVV